MKHLFLPLLLILPLFLAPVVVLGADAKPKAAETDQPTGGDKARVSLPPIRPGRLEADDDADKPTPTRPMPTNPSRARSGLARPRWPLFPSRAG